MSESIDLGSLEPIQVRYTIDRKNYVLKEASEATTAKFASMAAKGATLQDGKVSIGTHLGDLEPFLVSQCLWECDDAGAAIKPVPESAIRNWPSRIVKPLFSKAQEISGMREESPERKALLAAFATPKEGDFMPPFESLSSFRAWIKGLVEVDAKLYGPLWRLVEPKEDASPKN